MHCQDVGLSQEQIAGLTALPTLTESDVSVVKVKTESTAQAALASASEKNAIQVPFSSSEMKKQPKTKAEKLAAGHAAILAARQNPVFREAFAKMNDKSSVGNFNEGLQTALRILAKQQCTPEQFGTPGVQILLNNLNHLPKPKSASEDLTSYVPTLVAHLQKPALELKTKQYDGLLETAKQFPHRNPKTQNVRIARLELLKRNAKTEARECLKETSQLCEKLMLERRQRLNAYLKLTEQDLDSAEPVKAQKTAKKKKKKPKKKAAPAVVVHSCEAQLPEATPVHAAPGSPALTTKQARLKRLNEWFDHTPPPEHARARRWRTRNYNQIRLFWDGQGENKHQPYSDISDDDLKVIRRHHNLREADQLIQLSSHAFPTRTGCGMICRITDDRDHTSKYGTLYYGLNTAARNCVYHRYFKEQEMSMPEAEIIAGPEIDASEAFCAEEQEPETEEKWEIEGTYQKSISASGIIRLHYPQEQYSLYIYPVRADLLPAGLFHIE